jgi:glycerol-3-phosphate acyltransferase PlsY
VNPYPLAIVAVVAAYLIGAIPFGYLTALWVGGIDIRTVGSGNIGATNVGRVLGFRFFLFVFVLDLLKGLLPTYGLPLLVSHASGRAVPELPVFVALATILGHNFPVYLRFRGGKGVATSLGALLVLDWVASVSSAVGFVTFLLVTRYVSLSSLLGGLVFLAVHFVRTDNPWDRDHLAMSALTIGLVALLIVRHRKNLARIGAGTEPKVSLRKKKPHPEGRATLGLVFGLVAIALLAVYALSVQAARRSELTLGAYQIVEVARAGTGHQRADRVAFADGGRLLAVTCPRYNRLVVYRVTRASTLEPLRDIALEGQPMAVQTARDRFFVLERPAGDQRHVEPGWWETFDFTGQRVGTRCLAGMYPDDLAVTPDGHVLVATSGRAEGDAKRPAPALDVFSLADDRPRLIGGVTFERPGDDPCRITLSESGHYASVSLLGSDEVASIDLEKPAHPRIIGRTPLSSAVVPHLSATQADSILVAVTPESSAVKIDWPGSGSKPQPCLVCTLPQVTKLLFLDPESRRALGRLPLRAGSLNLSPVRPTGLAYSSERGLLAVANRAGGVHLIAVRERETHPISSSALASTAPRVKGRGARKAE